MSNRTTICLTHRYRYYCIVKLTFDIDPVVAHNAVLHKSATSDITVCVGMASQKTLKNAFGYLASRLVLAYFFIECKIVQSDAKDSGLDIARHVVGQGKKQTETS